MTAELTWHTLGEPRGRGWSREVMDRRYDRLPAHAHPVVPEVVWELSRHSSSLFHEFETDATEIHARWQVGQPELSQWHMPSTSVSGLDLYAADDTGRLRWAGVAAPTGLETEALLAEHLVPGRRRYRLYLPLLNELTDVQLGVPTGAALTPVSPQPLAPIAYYGTSIIHGASASRAGMSLPAILGRRLGRDVIGLGFSGNGKMEVALAELLSEIDAAVYVVDCLPNMDATLVRERALPFLRALRARRADTPVLLVEDRTLTNSWLRPDRQAAHDASRADLSAAYRELTAEGDVNLHYLGHEHLLGDDDEGTVDSSHPTDLGFVRMADRMQPVLAALLPAGQHIGVNAARVPE